MFAFSSRLFCVLFCFVSARQLTMAHSACYFLKFLRNFFFVLVFFFLVIDAPWSEVEQIPRERWAGKLRMRMFGVVAVFAVFSVGRFFSVDAVCWLFFFVLVPTYFFLRFPRVFFQVPPLKKK